MRERFKTYASQTKIKVKRRIKPSTDAAGNDGPFGIRLSSTFERVRHGVCRTSRGPREPAEKPRISLNHSPRINVGAALPREDSDGRRWRWRSA